VPHRTSQPPGNALIAVTFIGMFIMLIASTVVNNLMLSEVEAVEESLAKTRIYWASRGHLDYALSRIKREGVCDQGPGGCSANDGVGFPSGQQPDDKTRGISSPPDNRADGLRTYLRELYNDGGVRNWNYDPTPDTDLYRLSMQHTVEDAENGSVVDGYLRVTITLVETGTIDSLQGLSNRVRPVQIDVCLGAAEGDLLTSCKKEGPNPSTDVSNLTPEQSSGDSFVFRMRRPPSP
jgi:hypothetical protein